MPRNSSGSYSLPIAAFVPGGLIKSSDDNSNFSDIATALTQSLATTGVSTMTGALIGAPGLVTSPGYTFGGATKTGFYLAGTNQIGWASNGVQGATLNSDTSVNFAGNVTIAGSLSAPKGGIPVGAVADFAGAAAPSGWLLCFGQLVSTTTYALLFAQLSTTYGSGAGTFGIPDYRGRSLFGQDNMGGSAAGRITATVNFDGTVLGNTGGGQSSTLITRQSSCIYPRRFTFHYCTCRDSVFDSDLNRRRCQFLHASWRFIDSRYRYRDVYGNAAGRYEYRILESCAGCHHQQDYICGGLVRCHSAGIRYTPPAGAEIVQLPVRLCKARSGMRFLPTWLRLSPNLRRKPT